MGGGGGEGGGGRKNKSLPKWGGWKFSNINGEVGLAGGKNLNGGRAVINKNTIKKAKFGKALPKWPTIGWRHPTLRDVFCFKVDEYIGIELKRLDHQRVLAAFSFLIAIWNEIPKHSQNGGW